MWFVSSSCNLPNVFVHVTSLILVLVFCINSTDDISPFRCLRSSSIISLFAFSTSYFSSHHNISNACIHFSPKNSVYLSLIIAYMSATFISLLQSVVVSYSGSPKYLLHSSKKNIFIEPVLTISRILLHLSEL